MAKPMHMDKLVSSIAATVLLVTAWSLVLAGSFVPQWARALNVTNKDQNTTFSLWGREDCYGIICTTKYREIHREVKSTWVGDDGQNHVEVTEHVDVIPITTCVEANYCNITWFQDVEFDDVPSLLFVVKAFFIPSFIAGFITVVLYIIKIVMLVLRPLWRRLHIKAAYLTFSAIAGFSVGIGIIIFVTMLEKEDYELLWAPALPGVGGLLYIFIAFGGYLGWRNHSTDEEFDDRSEFSDRTSNLYEFSSSKATGKVQGHHSSRKGYHRSVSNQSAKSDKSDIV